MDLDKETRRLLDDAACLDAAPLRERNRLRQRLISGVAVGSISTSALVAKGAALGASGVSTVAATTSLSHLVVGAILVGFGAGAVVVVPTLLPRDVHPTKAVLVVRAPPAATAVTGGWNALPVAPEASNPNGAPGVETLKPLPPQTASVIPQSQAVTTSIGRETAMLGDVQRELKSGRPQLALEKLNVYLDQFPSGRLNEEATASRVVALCSLGRNREGQRWAVEFARRYPNSPLLSRVHGACVKSSIATTDVPAASDTSTE